MTQIVKKTTDGYLTFNDSTKDSVLTTYGTSKEFQSCQKSTYLPVDEEKTISSYNIPGAHTRFAYRPGDAFRQRHEMMGGLRLREVIHACRAAYMKVGVVRNVIDMMTDFAIEGLCLVHSDKKSEAFFRVWMAKVKLKEAANEFVRHLLIDGNTVVKRSTAILSKPVQDQWMDRAVASDNIKLHKEYQMKERQIPWRYTFLNVAALYWIGGEMAQATGEKKLCFLVSQTLLNAIRSPEDPFQQQFRSQLPADIKKATIEDNSNMIPLDMTRIHVSSNKKDSWEDWSPPFLFSILGDLNFKDKLRMAEISALDGMINVIRLWKLGDHTKGFLPAEGMIPRLIGILEANTGGGATDIVWDSLIDMQDFYPPIEKILGPEKYTQVNKDILIGLGVPEVLIGGEGANFSNSWIQLKTVIERLKYLRDRVREWLNKELELLCEGMAIKQVPIVKFDDMNLEDQTINKKLIVGLLDRNIISVEAVLKAYGEDYLVEIDRLQSEQKVLKSAKVEKLTPLDPLEPGDDDPPKELKRNLKKKGTKPNNPTAPPKKGKQPVGKPSGSQNIGNKTRTPKVRRAKANQTVFGMDIIDAIDEFIIPKVMEDMGVSNARKLTDSQKEFINITRSTILSVVSPEDDISEEGILIIAENLNTKNINFDIINLINENVLSYSGENGNIPSLSQRKRIEGSTWGEYYSYDENEEIE